ncbi:hypothetical protein BJ322DRAFT_1062892 [Thelephora terrestris]|uniref:Uncharacterized protein n=1 Tax=Thelephora terrestris TaxID=56493 RepID=A0A9P6L7C5_9AGAM|nr:hypothetical protein BJ322DRAFT_1062892 [Thelephora terrestris]
MDDASEDENQESSSVHANEAAPEEQAERKEKINQEPVLTMDPFSGWKSLFFYSCTNVINFAPLKSQGVEVRAQHGVGYSPRVIYSLATALEIEPLRDLALNDIRSKITSTNLIPELFSSFASRYEDIAKMECELMYDEYNDENTTAEGIKFIESVPGGNLAHRAGALKIVLKEGLLNRVFLRCPNLGCSMHNNTAPYRSFGQVTTCPHHPARPYLECAGYHRPSDLRHCEVPPGFRPAVVDDSLHKYVRRRVRRCKLCTEFVQSVCVHR